MNKNKLSAIVATTTTIGTALIVAAGSSTIVTVACTVALVASYAFFIARLHVHYNTSGL